MKYVGKVLEWIGFLIIVITDVLWINDSVLGVVCGIHILASLLMCEGFFIEKTIKKKGAISGKKQFIYG